MRVVTFFSYKGGVGRTLAATNFAVYLAKLGLNVVLIDFDFDAPGVDSKFPEFSLASGQKGMLDYVLEFQRTGNPPGPVSAITCQLELSSPRGKYTLNLIPVGDYLAPNFADKLHELDWDLIFSKDRQGVAFFQLFLDRLKSELQPAVVVIDSRTGFSEIGGLCTQQLADETVILSSLASESVKMTRHLAQLIRSSSIAHELGKDVKTKVVVSRVPRPQDIDKFKAECCELFGVPSADLFFLFSCSGLEREEFVAILDSGRNDTLTANYMQLFQGLNVELAQASINEEIERTERGLLSCLPDEAERRIREMVALYPHPEVYRRAMRFFNLTQRPHEAALFAMRLLELSSDDNEAQLFVAKFVLRPRNQLRFRQPRKNEGFDLQAAIAVAKRVNERGELTLSEKVQLSDFLAEQGEASLAFKISMQCLESAELDDIELRGHAMAIAVRTGVAIGKKKEVGQLLAPLSPAQLRWGIAVPAIQLKAETSGKREAFELAKAVLASTGESEVVTLAANLARDIGCVSELIELIGRNPEMANDLSNDPRARWELEHLGIDFGDLHRLISGRQIRPRRLR